MPLKYTSFVVVAASALIFAYLNRTGAQKSTGSVIGSSMGLLGGFSSINGAENDAEVQKAAKFAVNEIHKNLKLEKIISAQRQVVAGTNYKLELQTSSGNFEVVVFKGLGDAPLKLTSYTRTDNCAGGNGMLGGKKEVPSDHKDVQAAAEAVVKQLSSQSNNLKGIKLDKVIKAHSKVHGNGTVYSLLLSVSPPNSTYQAEVTRTLQDKYEIGTVTRAEGC